MQGMNIQSHYRWLKGFKTLERKYYEETHLVDEKAEYRLKVLLFWKKYDLEATLDAFDVSERTLYNWKKKYKLWEERVYSLSDCSRKPHTSRKRIWDSKILDEVVSLRELYPNLWKEKLHPFVVSFCEKKNLSCPSVSTLWRLIKDLWGIRCYTWKKIQKNTKKKKDVLRKPWNLVAMKPWTVVALDSVEIRWVGGMKRYVVTIIDIHSRYSHAVVTSSHSSKTAMSIFREFESKFPFKIESVLTDNGSEFMLHFRNYLEKQNITHYHTYPRCPKMNAHCERFNRTIREWVLNMNRYNLENLEHGNKLIRDFLIFYNTKRVHLAFKNKLTPLQKLSQYVTMKKNTKTAI